MRKSTRIVGILVLGLLVGVAVGSARKIRMFSPQGSELPTADGAAVLNYIGEPNPTTIVQVMLTGFTPYTTYDLELRSPVHGSLFGYGVVSTDDQGNAQFHTEVPGIDVSDSSMYLYVNASLEGEELRAVGLQ